jgi:hypothetical protein
MKSHILNGGISLVSHNLYKKTEFGNAKIANVVAS